MKKILLLVVLCTSLLSSCSDDEIIRDPDSIGYQYYPLEVKNFWVFNVTENHYRQNVRTETSSYQTRELIDAIIKDQEGREWYRVELSRRSSESSNWVVNGVKLISRSTSDLRVQEGNQTTVRMVYPVKNGYSFISNAFIDGDPSNRVYLDYADLGEPFTENGKTYDNTLTVVKSDFEYFIDKIEDHEVYAFGVGPVKRSTVEYHYCNDPSSGCSSGTEFIVNGSDKTEVLDSYGKLD